MLRIGRDRVIIVRTERNRRSRLREGMTNKRMLRTRGRGGAG